MLVTRSAVISSTATAGRSTTFVAAPKAANRFERDAFTSSGIYNASLGSDGMRRLLPALPEGVSVEGRRDLLEARPLPNPAWLLWSSRSP